MSVEIKGGYRRIRSKNIVITTLWSPEEMFKGTMQDQDLNQLYRHIEKVIHLVSQDPQSGKIKLTEDTMYV